MGRLFETSIRIAVGDAVLHARTTMKEWERKNIMACIILDNTALKISFYH